MEKPTYEQIYSELCHNIVMIIFLKKTGELRVMLATKNEAIAMTSNKMQIIPSRYIRESKESGNISVIDLETKERRSFNLERLLSYHIFGTASTEQEYTKIQNEYAEFKIRYLQELNKTETSEADDIELFNSLVDKN